MHNVKQKFLFIMNKNFHNDKYNVRNNLMNKQTK